jgi:hypothetical protein
LIIRVIRIRLIGIGCPGLVLAAGRFLILQVVLDGGICRIAA